MRRLLALLLAALALPAGHLSAAEAGSPWRGMPWHLMDYYHVLPDGQPFRSVAIELEVVRPPQPGDHVYIAALSGSIGDQKFYAGLQTDLHDGWTRTNRGEGLIFSRWGNGEAGDGRAPADGWVVVPNPNAAKEGAYVSIRRPMAWDVGRYLFQLQARPLSDGHGGGGMWVDLLVYDVARGTWIDGGGLRFDAAPATFRPRPASFVEVYRLEPGEDARSVPPMEVILRGPVLNGAHGPLGGTARIPKDVPPLARATAGEGAVTIVVEPAP
ncbi:hypothetical protein ACM64Y_08870 [Novispirillum sp. DQ9]|uniref:hypothetical protein n=1 Tax=Novispirillum sp. DQ9 TaxID=3398612 RepID=UPI003C7BCBBD